MENTQVIDWDAEEEEETEIPSGSLGYSLEPIGQLRLFSSTHGPERDFPLYLGKNVIGRSPDCSVALPFPSISKQHAVIEISACNKAPILQDCGSLNGTQLVKPPKVLTPGVSHRLKDQELILFADFPCQYRRLDVPPPLVSRGLLTIEKTPRIQGGSQTSRVLLAEDSEEEVDFPSGRYVANGSRNPTSPSATVVPESDEEGSSPAQSVRGPSLPFDLGSDTDEELCPQPAVGESSSVARDGAAAEAKQLEANGVTSGIQLVLAQPAEQKLRDAKVKSEAGNGAAVVGRGSTVGKDSNTEMGEEHQPSGFVDSDTDVEEDRIPVTPPVVPGKKQVLLGVGKKDPGAPVVTHLQDSPAGRGTGVEEGKTPVAGPPERNHTAMVISSDTDEEDGVSAAVTLAHLKDRGMALWSREPGMEEVKSQPQVLVERSQSASGKDSDTDVEEEKREVVPDSPMDTDEALTVPHSESQAPHRASDDVDQGVDMGSPGGQLEGNQASSATVEDSSAQAGKEVLPPEEAWETAVEEGSSSAAADVRQSKQPGVEDAGTEWAATVCEQASMLEVGVQGRSPATLVEPVVVPTATLGDPTQPQREGAQTPTGKERGVQMGRTKNAKDCRDGQLSCKMASAGEDSRGDPEPSAHRLLSPVPEASSPPQSLLTSQSQKPSTPQSLLLTSPPSELHLPETPHTKPNVRPRRSSRMTSSPHSSAALKPYTTCPTNLPAAPRPTSRATRGRGRANRSSTRTPEPVVPTDSELQPPTSTEQSVIPKPTSPVTQGSINGSFVKTPEPVVLTGPKIQPPTSTEQPVTPNPTPQATRGRPHRSSIQTPEPLTPTGPDLQPPTSTEQPVIPKPTSRAARGRSRKSSTRTPEPAVPTGPDLQPPTSTEQPVTPKPTSRATRGRSRKSVRTPEPAVPTGPDLQLPTSTALGTLGRACKSSIEDSESVGPVASDFEPPISTDLVAPEVTGQSITLKSSPLSASPVSATSELQPPVPTAQPVLLEPIPQANHRRRRKAAGKRGSHTVPIGQKPYSAPSEPGSQSSINQGLALEAAESITVAPEPAVSQAPETSTQNPVVQNEAAGRSGLIPKPQPEVSRSRKKPSTTTTSPIQKRPRRQIPQKTIVPKEEDPEEMPVKEEPQEIAIPTPGKRKRDRVEDETQGNPSRSRRAKPNQEAAAPKVLFTGVVDSRGERAVLALGGSLASSVNEASHLVTDRIRRTVKFLCALGKGIPILSLNWLYQSRKAGHFLPPDDYLVTDPEQEKNFSFSLRDSLSRARQQKLLEGYEIYVTPGVQPPPPQMGEIISCCGGTNLPSMPQSYKPYRVVITCTEDLPRCAIPSRLGLPLLSPEFLLTGVLKQEVTPEAFVLSN
ncbi:mediator of DNA damage checkpoint 1 [Cricetulus griseus]